MTMQGFDEGTGSREQIKIDLAGFVCCIVVQEATMTTLTIRLPDDLRADLDKLSKAEHKAVSDIVRESIRRYVAIQRFRALRGKVVPFAEAQGFITDEDVFRAIS